MKQTPNLFAYGSLMHPAVLRNVLGEEGPVGCPALLPGHARYKVKGESFPGIIREEGAQVEGCLIEGLTCKHWEQLDRFEDCFYERLQVTVLVDGQSVLADAYVVPHSRSAVLSTELWSFSDFLAGKYGDFLGWIDFNP